VRRNGETHSIRMARTKGPKNQTPSMKQLIVLLASIAVVAAVVIGIMVLLNSPSYMAPGESSTALLPVDDEASTPFPGAVATWECCWIR
jgi:hypothetical protein